MTLGHALNKAYKKSIRLLSQHSGEHPPLLAGLPLCSLNAIRKHENAPAMWFIRSVFCLPNEGENV